MRAFTSTTGTVEQFDEARGLGTVRGDDGSVLAFHCTAIADGSRTIEVGSRVRYEVVAGLMGRWEAAHIEPAGAPGTGQPAAGADEPDPDDGPDASTNASRS